MKKDLAEPKQTADRLEDLYALALKGYVAGAGEMALRRAYEIGRLALAEGRGVLDMAELHSSALVQVLSELLPQEESERRLHAAAVFFGESLSPYEMAHRGFREANAALRRLNDVLEQEIKRIAHALHDDAGQLLVALRIALAELARDLKPPHQGRIGDLNRFLDQIEGHLRRFSHELRPTVLDDLGLVPALEFLTDGVTKRSGLAITLETSFEGRLPPPVETVLYRVVQEALNNVTKHAKATEVRVRLLRKQGGLDCRILDNGVGFESAAPTGRKGETGLGLIAMRERLSALGGTLKIQSARGQGTELFIAVPLQE